MAEIFWIGLISFSASLGYKFGAPVGWAIFGGILMTIALLVAASKK